MKQYAVKYSIMERDFQGPGISWKDFPENSPHVKTAYYAAETPDAAAEMLKADFSMFRTEIHGEPSVCENPAE